MNIINITSNKELKEFISDNEGVVLYFSTPQCNVCKVLKPKLIELLNDKFPLMKFSYIDCDQYKELAAKYNVFVVPTILFLIKGKEFIRKSRNVSLAQLEEEIIRPYSLFFNN